MGNTIKFACLVGLRPSEVLESVRLLNSSQRGINYYNPDRQALEHFRFPEIFLRQTKKAYISFVSPSMISEITNNLKFQIIAKVSTYNAIRLTCQRKGIKCDFRYTRKIFASWLRQEGGIQPEVVDMLQGRVSQSVLTRHYLTPSNDLKDRVLSSLSKLSSKL